MKGKKKDTPSLVIPARVELSLEEAKALFKVCIILAADYQLY